jgi:hypothetical protein
MLLLVLGCGFILALAALFALSFFMVSVVGSCLQTRADAIALQAGTAINANDPVGQMNTLISRCRLLVETSRQSCDVSGTGNNRHLSSLAQFLLEQSRNSANLLEDERKKLMALKVAQVDQIANQELERTALCSVLPWVRIKQLSIEELQVGTIRNLSSNVQADKNEFYERDLRRDYVDKASTLYRGNINAKLPEADRDLSFNISSLPAPVGNNVSPSYLIAADRFVSFAAINSEDRARSITCAQIPAAVQLRLSCRIIDQLTGQECTVERTATSCTNGAQPPP